MENSKAQISNEDFIKASILFAKNSADEATVRTTYFVPKNSKKLFLKKPSSYIIVESSKDGDFLIFRDLNNIEHRLQVASAKEALILFGSYNFHEEFFTKETRYICEEFVYLDDKKESFACILHKFDKEKYLEIEYRPDLSEDLNERGSKTIFSTYGIKPSEITKDDWIKILRGSK